MNINLALKIVKALNMDEGYRMILQIFYDIKESKKKQAIHPDLSKLSTTLF